MGGLPAALSLLAVLGAADVDPPARRDGRADAVFVLREGGRADGFLDAATAYYRAHGGGALLVDSAGSLEEIREWLDRSPLRGRSPWGRVVLVTHGSPWRGLTMRLWRDGDRGILPSALHAAATDGSFPPLDDAVLDDRSILVVESCGLARRPELLDALARLLGGDDVARPRWRASAGWVVFGSGAGVPWREEVPFAAEIRPGTPDRDAIARAADRRGEVAQFGRVRLAIEVAAGPCRGASKRWLRTVPEVGQVLRDHALRRDELTWSFAPTREGGCEIVGAGTLVVRGRAPLPPALIGIGDEPP
jgi:hypothetical protein